MADIPRQHQQRIAKATLRMNPAMVGVMGGPSIAEAKKILRDIEIEKNLHVTVHEAMTEIHSDINKARQESGAK